MLEKQNHSCFNCFFLISGIFIYLAHLHVPCIFQLLIRGLLPNHRTHHVHPARSATPPPPHPLVRKHEDTVNSFSHHSSRSYFVHESQIMDNSLKNRRGDVMVPPRLFQSVTVDWRQNPPRQGFTSLF